MDEERIIMDEERITMDEETTKKERRKCGWYMLGILDHIVFVAAMLVGMWIKTSNTVFLVTGGCGLLVIILCMIMMHCFCLEKVSGLVCIDPLCTCLWVVIKCSFHLWCGCFLGLISFIGIDTDQVEEIPLNKTTVIGIDIPIALYTAETNIFAKMSDR